MAGSWPWTRNRWALGGGSRKAIALPRRRRASRLPPSPLSRLLLPVGNTGGDGGGAATRRGPQSTDDRKSRALPPRAVTTPAPRDWAASDFPGHERNKPCWAEPGRCDLQPDRIQGTGMTRSEPLIRKPALSQESAGVRTATPSGARLPAEQHCGAVWSPGAQQIP